jgi:hypothetical protein
MPVLLKPDQFDDWLSGAMGVKDLRPADVVVPNDVGQ